MVCHLVVTVCDSDIISSTEIYLYTHFVLGCFLAIP
jgi:hypothetical protein